MAFIKFKQDNMIALYANIGIAENTLLDERIILPSLHN